MDRAEYYNKIEEVLKNFPEEFKEKYRTNAFAHRAVEALVRGESPYNILHQLIQTLEDQQSALLRATELNPHPWYYKDIKN